MSASWKLIAELGERRTVELVWNDRADPSVHGSIREDQTVIEDKDFEEQVCAEDWVAALGAKSLVAVETCHAFPLAERLKISFPDAPTEQILENVLDEVIKGASLSDVAARLKAHPAIVRAWLIGFAPSCPQIQGWRVRRSRRK